MTEREAFRKKVNEPRQKFHIYNYMQFNYKLQGFQTVAGCRGSSSDSTKDPAVDATEGKHAVRLSPDQSEIFSPNKRH